MNERAEIPGWVLVTEESGQVRIEKDGQVRALLSSGAELAELRRFLESIPRRSGRPPGRRVTYWDVLKLIHEFHAATGREPTREEILAELNAGREPGQELFRNVESLSRAVNGLTWQQLTDLATNPRLSRWF